MSGFYQNWIKVQNPEMSNNIVPMESGGFQTPFYFGGSQVPIALNLKGTDLDISGNGINGYRKTNFMPEIRGKGIQSTQMSSQSRIHMPRHLGGLTKQI